MRNEYFIEQFPSLFSMKNESFCFNKEQSINIMQVDFGQILFVLTRENEKVMKMRCKEDCKKKWDLVVL